LATTLRAVGALLEQHHLRLLRSARPGQFQ
jgi:hypothetical protein